MNNKLSPEAVIKSLEVCGGNTHSCAGCVFHRKIPHNVTVKISGSMCHQRLMLAAAEYLRETYEPEEWVEDEDFDGDTVYSCPKCGVTFYMGGENPEECSYNYCPGCGKRLEMPEEG